jgi:hypothetical protein
LAAIQEGDKVGLNQEVRIMVDTSLITDATITAPCRIADWMSSNEKPSPYDIGAYYWIQRPPTSLTRPLSWPTRPVKTVRR